MTEPVTVAQETVTNAMLAALISCAALSLALVEYLQLTSSRSYAVLAMLSFVVAAYIVPNVVAFWLGRPLEQIMSNEAPPSPTRKSP